MPKVETRPFDVVNYLKTDEDVVAYLTAVLEEGNASSFAAALGDVARAKGMAEVARAAGLGRESLYKGLSTSGNPELATVLRVMEALGLRLCASSAIREQRVSVEA